MTTLVRARMGREDASWWDGKTRTFTRTDSTGGSQSLTRWGDEVDVEQVYGTLERAVAEVGSNQASLRLAPKTWVVSSSLTIPGNITLSMPRGALLSPETGVTVTLNGTLDAGLYQVFTGAGTVTSSNIAEVVYPQWWGAAGERGARWRA